MKSISFLFKLYLIIIFIITDITNIISVYVYAKDITNKKNVEQLNHIFEAHGQYLMQIQQQLSDNQKNIDILRGNIQEIQRHILQIVHDQKELSQKLYVVLNNNPKNPHYFHDIDKLHTNSNIKKNNGIIDDVNEISVDTEYKKAVALVLEKKQYDHAIQAFQTFIKSHPKSGYQPNAHYWLGQLYYNKNNKEDASYHFALVVSNYPNSSKASDALLKVGIIMQETKQKNKAQIIYRQVGKLYPNSNAAKLAQKRLMHL